MDEEFENTVAMNLFPNPTDANSTLQFNMPQTGKLQIEIIDMLGRKAEDIYNGEMPVGEQQIFMPTENLSRGIYMVKLTIDGKTVTKKLVIK